VNLATSAARGLAEGILGGIDDLFTSDEEREAAGLRVQELVMRPHILQAMTTLAEASHPNWFVAGWRPALGWVCVAGLGWQFVVRPLLGAALVAAAVPFEALPSLEVETLITLVLTLLGLGGARTVERLKGVARG